VKGREPAGKRERKKKEIGREKGKAFGKGKKVAPLFGPK